MEINNSIDWIKKMRGDIRHWISESDASDEAIENVLYAMSMDSQLGSNAIKLADIKAKELQHNYDKE